ncbi:Uncharacterized protein OBRU01_25998 [Operophtera brumata]|uniref:Uncharacterized protein n=1 Tax=Operophtera brumata TaxID=104452 RepID=A0A0L7K3D3_OPEBR|nr:Uncharacterized protein OBRU01_25998 [Operophtera brumata]
MIVFVGRFDDWKGNWNEKMKLGENIPKEISERWGKILLDGLVKEQKEAVKENMVIPKNFLLVQAPKLNPEEVAQISLDLHYEETINRRKLLLPLLDKSFWNMAHGVKKEAFLFGDKLGETIKNSKDIEKSSQQIKNLPPRSKAEQIETSRPLLRAAAFDASEEEFELDAPEPLQAAAAPAPPDKFHDQRRH